MQRDGRDVEQHAANHRDGLKSVRHTIVHQDRAAPCADRLRDLLEDRRGGLLERDRAPQNLGDRVEKVDLLVALGELVGGVLDFERRLEVLPDDGGEEARVALERSVRDRRWAGHDPCLPGAGNARDDHGSAWRLRDLQGHVFERGRPAENAQGGNAGRDSRGGTRIVTEPDRRRRTGSVAERGEQRDQVNHGA